MDEIEQPMNDTFYSSVHKKKYINHIEYDILHISVDNISTISTYICIYHQSNLIIPLLNYLFKSNINSNIKYKEIEHIYITSCIHGDIVVLQQLILHCFKYNYKFDIHCCADEAFFNACYYGFDNIIQYLIIRNKKYYYSHWTHVIEISINAFRINKFFDKLKYLFHIKQMKYKTNYYIFNNNTDYICDFYQEIFDKPYTSYILYLEN